MLPNPEGPVQAVKDEAKVPGDWDRHLQWLNDVLSEVWQNRGPFPGIGTVLQYLGCESGTAFQRQVLVPLLNKGENAWEYVLAIYDRQEFLEEVASKFPESLRWPNYGLPPARLVLLPGNLKAFTDAGDEVVSHGGIALEEVLVPFVAISREGT